MPMLVLTPAFLQEAILVDVRTPSEFGQGSVPKAINIPLDQLKDNFNQLDKSKTIVVFCQSGNRSRQAKTFLEEKGFVKVINGGSWKEVLENIEKNK